MGDRCTAQRSTLQHSAAQRITAQHSTAAAEAAGNLCMRNTLLHYSALSTTAYAEAQLERCLPVAANWQLPSCCCYATHVLSMYAVLGVFHLVMIQTSQELPLKLSRWQQMRCKARAAWASWGVTPPKTPAALASLTTAMLIPTSKPGMLFLPVCCTPRCAQLEQHL